MRLLVTGARAWTDRERLFEALEDAVIEERSSGEGIVLVHGACPTGADSLADEWGRFGADSIERHPADWNQHGKSAGFIRNAEMVKLGADLVVGFISGPSRGTRHTLDLARKAGLRVIEVMER